MSSYNPLELRAAKDIILINTLSDKDYLAYTKTSLEKKKLVDNPDVKKSIEFVLKSGLPISEKYKEKAIIALGSVKKSQIILEELQSRNTDNFKVEKPGIYGREILQRLSPNEPYNFLEKSEEPSVSETDYEKTLKKPDEIKAKKFQTFAEIEALMKEDNGLEDDFLTEFKTKGYTEKEQEIVRDKVNSLSDEKALEFLTEMKISPLPITAPLAEEIEMQSVPITDTMISSATEAQEAQEAQPPQETQAQLSESQIVPNLVSSSGPVLPFIKRYHPNSLLLYFNSSSYPNWDLTLESNVMKIDTNPVEMMDDIIREYGPKIFVKKRLSDTKEELNELLQLQFIVMRNLKPVYKGSNAQTATVKLSDLVKIDRLANGSVSEAPSGLVVNPIIPVATPSSSTPSSATQRSATESEDNFIRNYDAYLTQKNLNSSLAPTRTIKKEEKVYGQDPRNINILSGNNLITLQKTKSRRI